MGDLSYLEKLDFVPAIVQAFCQTIVAAIRFPFLQRAPRNFPRHVLLSFFRVLFARLSTAQLQYAMGSTESNLRTWAKSENIRVQEVELTFDATKAFWIGDPETANAIVVYYHGGGYAMPGNAAHFTLLKRLVAHAEKTKSKTVAALVLQYDLAPEKQYPHQLIQSVEALRYVTERMGKKPSQTFLGGDSSGGSLVLGVLSHLLHPHAEIAPLELSEPLAGAVLHSPVVQYDFSSERFYTHQIYEPSSTFTLNNWIGGYLQSPGDSDNWSEPLHADKMWWKGLDRVVKEMMITVARDEVFADDVQALLPKIQAVYPSLTFFSSAKDFHAEPGIGYAIGLTEESEAATVAKEWIVERL